MVNLSALQDLTPLIINTSIVNDTENILPNLVANTNTLTNNWFGLLVMIGVFIWLFWILFDDRGRFRLDTIKAWVISSGVTLIVGIVMIVSNLTSTFNHVVWFGVIFTLGLIASWILKQKGG